jgi:hypothetical protein
LIATRYIIIQLIAAAVGAYVAGKKGRNWAVWGILCFFFPFMLVIVVFLPSVLSQGVTKQCPECGRIISHDAVTCDYCKRALPIEMVQCPRCGKYLPEGQKCPDCSK